MTVVLLILTGLLHIPRLVPGVLVVSAANAGIRAPVDVSLVQAFGVEYLTFVEVPPVSPDASDVNLGLGEESIVFRVIAEDMAPLSILLVSAQFPLWILVTLSANFTSLSCRKCAFATLFSKAHIVARDDVSVTICSFNDSCSCSDLVKGGPFTIECFQLTGLLPLVLVVPGVPVVSAVDAGVRAPVDIPVVLALGVEYLAVPEVAPVSPDASDVYLGLGEESIVIGVFAEGLAP